LQKDYDNVKYPELENELKASLDEIKQSIDKLSPEDQNLIAELESSSKVDKGVGASAVTEGGGQSSMADQIRAHEAAIKIAIPCVGA
jgi:hypothetical protein